MACVGRQHMCTNWSVAHICPRMVLEKHMQILGVYELLDTAAKTINIFGKKGHICSIR